MLYFCRNRFGCGFCGTSDPTPTTTPGTVDCRRPPGSSPALRASCTSARARRGRSAGTSTGRSPRRARPSARESRVPATARAPWIRVVIAVAEEQAVVVVGRRACARWSTSAGLVGPSASSQSSSSPIECGCSKTRSDRRPNSERIALVLHAKAPHRNAVDLSRRPAELVAPRDVVGRARRQDLDVGVPREVLGDVAGVQLGAAVDCLAVALNDDRELHWRVGVGRV